MYAPACPPARVPFLAESRPPSPLMSCPPATATGCCTYLVHRWQRARPQPQQAASEEAGLGLASGGRAGEAHVPLGLTLLPAQRHFGLLHYPAARVRASILRPPIHLSILVSWLRSSPKRLRARSPRGRRLAGGRGRGHRRRAKSHASTAVSVATATAMLRTTKQKKEKSSFNSPRITLCSAEKKGEGTTATSAVRSSSGAFVVDRDNKHRAHPPSKSQWAASPERVIATIGVRRKQGRKECHSRSGSGLKEEK